jgi:hypothetical protein
MAESSESGTDKILITVAALVAGVVAQRVVMMTWRTVRGTDPTQDEDSSVGEILVFAAVSAAAVAAAKTWAMQKTRQQRRPVSAT